MSPDSRPSRFDLSAATVAEPRSRRPALGLDIVAELEHAGLEDVAEIGRGGFGTVYRCSQPALDRTVAVKVLSAELDEENRERFLREEHAMGRLSGHPNIVDILQVGVTSDGRPYILMPFHARGSLEYMVQQGGPLRWTEAVRVGIKLAGALESAHWMGILHRDVKPANILITAYDEPQLTDFGIARVPGSYETTSGFLAGSPAYIAPEVLAGRSPGPASDVYGLGSTLFTLVTGHAAYERRAGEKLMAQFRRITEQPIPDLHDLAIPDDLSAVIEAAMAGDPDRRPPSAAELGQLLQRVEHEHGLPTDKMALPADIGQPQPGTTPHRSGPVVVPTSTGQMTRRPTAIRHSAPVATHHELQRRRLISLLDASSHRIVEIVAPGGHGKSFLAKQWRDELIADGEKVAWLRLSADTTNEDLFAAVTRAGFTLIKDDIHALAAAFRTGGRTLTLFIDGYDRLANGPLRDTIDVVLHSDCAELRVVVTSRSPIPSSPADAVKIGGEALKFTPEEARDMMLRVHGLELSLDEASDLVSAVNGLPTALHLVAVALRGGADPEVAPRVPPGAVERAAKSIRRVRGGADAIASFLVGNVLNAIEPRMSDFLVAAASSNLHDMNESSQRLLSEAVRRHLLVQTTESAIDFESEPFTPVVADLLRLRHVTNKRA